MISIILFFYVSIGICLVAVIGPVKQGIATAVDEARESGFVNSITRRQKVPPEKLLKYRLLLSSTSILAWPLVLFAVLQDRRVKARSQKAAYDDAMHRLARYLDDDEYQNSLMDPASRRELMYGAAVDELPNAQGPFGMSPSNPIPVNGSIGELTYLSKLRTSTGERLLFHRLERVGTIDAFEAVSWSGNEWYLLYLDMYHPRRSRKAPAGFIVKEGPSHFSGFTKNCQNFPHDFLEYRAEVVVASNPADHLIAGVPPQDAFDLAYISAPTIEKILAAASNVGEAAKSAMEGIWRLIDDEAYQNDMLPAPISDAIKGGSAVDNIPNGCGAFGLDKANPIPVNGALGELAYLSRLETVKGERLLFHRVGAINRIDVFEAVTITGTSWHVLFLDLYHPRRSRLAPEGFRLGEPGQFTGFLTYCPNFPYDFVECKRSAPGILGFAYIAISSVAPALEQKLFSRPLAHAAQVTIVEGMITSRHV